MKRFLIIFNGKGIKDFNRYADARKAYEKKNRICNPDEDMLELVNIETGEILATNE